MNYAQRLKETLRTGLDVGFKAGVQKGCDLWMAALAQEGFWSQSAGTVSRHFVTEIRTSSSSTIKGGNENE